MNAIHQLLTDHIDIWTAADTEKKSGRGRGSGNAASVYGIKKLRELILELAVHGKLVPQDANDEPASELLKRIQAEKAKLIAEGKIKKSKPLPPDEKPFELPKGWEWVRLGSIGISSTGRTPSTQNSTLYGESIPFIGPGQITLACELLPAEKWLSEAGRNETTIAKTGDILMVCIGGSIGKSAIADKELGFNQQINCISPLCVESKFVHICMMANSFQSKILEFATGSATPIINKSKWEELLISVSPLAEQHRIVAKVDELMTLCDQLESQHNNAAEAHEKLVRHLLGTLTQSQSAEDFNGNWQRIAAHFDSLFTTEASIDALKQILLQLAVMGKLVPQDPNDEPASELLKRIQAEKAKLIAEGKIKKDKSPSPISENEKPFELPKGWEWVKLFEVTTGMDSGWSPACLENSSPSDTVWGVLKTTAVQVMHYLEHENKELPDKLVPRPEAEVKAGDILFTRAGPTNRVAISCLVQATRPKLMISDKIIRFHPIDIYVDGRFITLCLNTGATAVYFENAKSGMAASQVNISQEKLRAAPIPIPPLALQHRIVAKVDELMALCDALKTRINEAQRIQIHLADTIANQALA